MRVVWTRVSKGCESFTNQLQVRKLQRTCNFGVITLSSPSQTYT
jgi:hypothetical protein